METLHGLNEWSVLFRILLATVIGGSIGNERGRHGRAAGLRTHILVCLGSAMTTMVGMYTATVLGFANDPLRVGAQVISGIGFIGVGTIMVRNRSQVTGLTTAAGLWTTACIGLAIGIGFYLAAIAAFIAVMVTVSVLSKLERPIRRRDSGSYYIELMDIHRVNDFYGEVSTLVSEVEVVPAKSGIASHVGLEFMVSSQECGQTLLTCLQARDDVVIAVPLRQS